MSSGRGTILYFNLVSWFQDTDGGIVWMAYSDIAPGYWFQYQVPPTSPAASMALVLSPSSRSRFSWYRPPKPAPTTSASISWEAMLSIL